MQNTTNYNLKKPEYTDFADIKDINDNMDKIDEELAAPTGDTADSKATFTCSDVSDGDAAAWTNVPALTSGETHKSIFAKMSQMFKNLRYLYKLLGTTDISSIGNGTVTGGLSSLNDSFTLNEYAANVTFGSDANHAEHWVNIKWYDRQYSLRFGNAGITYRYYNGSTWTNIWTK